MRRTSRLAPLARGWVAQAARVSSSSHSSSTRSLTLFTARRSHANMRSGCATCLYRHECFPAHFSLPPVTLPAEESVRRLLPSSLLALSVVGTGLFLWSERERLGALSLTYLGQDVFKTLLSGRSSSTPSTMDEEDSRHKVWDMLSTRPEILNSFLFCSCGCGEKVDFNEGRFEMKSGRVFTRAHFKCDSCGKQLQGTTSPHSHSDHDHQHEEEGWVFHKGGKLYCVYDFMDQFCRTCSACGHDLGDQLAVDPRLGAAFCVDCFQADHGNQAEPPFRLLERVETQSQGDALLREVKIWLSKEMGLAFEGSDGDIPLSLYRPEKMEQMQGMNKKEATNDRMGSTLGLTVKQASSRSLFSKKTYTPKEVVLVKGLSREHAGAVLAHEMMHCWIGLYLSRTAELPEEVEEGLCELMSYFWLVQRQSQIEANQKEEVDYLLGRMERNWDNAQGRGFHKAIASLQGQEEGNLRLLLAHARQHSTLPSALPSL